jgi:membrane-associated protease RseP (regulator of RpoE activity)
MMRSKFLSSLLVVGCFLIPALLRAELPPGAYEELLKDAQEVLDVQITKVTPAGDLSPGEPQFACSAKVLRVDRSKSGVKVGDSIQFKSYYVTEATRRSGWAGPQVPPRLAVGQSWRVSLNADKAGEPFRLAAFGRSFQPLASKPAPNDSPDRLGVMASPAQGGGLQIASVSRRSIGDKLGLRPGDRVLEINGAPVNSVAEVASAIAQNQQRVEVKFVRGEDTIELTLKR